MNGLQPHLHPQIGAFVQLRQIIDDIIRQAIRPGGDRQADDAGLAQDRFIIFPQLLDRRIRVRICLKIADIVGFRPFLMLTGRGSC